VMPNGDIVSAGGKAVKKRPPVTDMTKLMIGSMGASESSARSPSGSPPGPMPRRRCCSRSTV
jgi:hypothetical protein